MPNVIRARDGRLVEDGMTVRVQGCVGPYGQTEITEGRVIKVWPSLQCLILETPSGSKTVGVNLDGHHRHEDFEHGHEVWTEIVGG